MKIRDLFLKRDVFCYDVELVCFLFAHFDELFLFVVYKLLLMVLLYHLAVTFDTVLIK